MAQSRYWNLRDEDSTFRLNTWLLGILPFGVYRGFDLGAPQGMNLVLVHTLTGYQHPKKDRSGLTPHLGILRSRQGVVIAEDAPLVLPIQPNATANPRKDLVVCSHSYAEVQGGEQALYSVVMGNPSAAPVAPGVQDQMKDVAVGVLTVPANTQSLEGAVLVWERSPTPLLGDDPNRLPVVLSRNKTIAVQLVPNNGRTEFNIQATDQVLKAVDLNGFFVHGQFSINTPLNAPGESQWWYVDSHVHNAATRYATQTATDLFEGGTYTRTCNGGGWRDWRRIDEPTLVELQNPDFNTLIRPGTTYRVGASGEAPHKPQGISQESFLVQVVGSGDFLTQFVYEQNSPLPYVHMRSYSSYQPQNGRGGWTPWVVLTNRGDLDNLAAALNLRLNAQAQAIAALQNAENFKSPEGAYGFMAQFRRDGGGHVHLRGSWFAKEDQFTQYVLPVGYRPAVETVFPISGVVSIYQNAGSGAVYKRIIVQDTLTVYPDGRVVWTASNEHVLPTGWLTGESRGANYEGINFKVAG